MVRRICGTCPYHQLLENVVWALGEIAVIRRSVLAVSYFLLL